MSRSYESRTIIVCATVSGSKQGVHLWCCLHRFDGPHAEAGTGRNLAYSSAEATWELSGVRRSRALSKVTFKWVLFTLARVTASAVNWQGYDGLELALSSLLVLCSSVGLVVAVT